MCKNYNKGCRKRTASPQDKKCWRKWQLCGDCAAVEHPEEYTPRYVKKILSKIRCENDNSL